MSRHKTKQRIMAMVLSAIMVVGMMPVSAFAETSTFPIGTSGEIIAFEALGADISMRSVPLATNESDLKLPNILTTTIRLAVLDEETVLDSGETDAKLDSAGTVSGSAIGMDEKDNTKAGAEASIASPSDAQEDGDYFEAELMEKTVDSIDEITVPLSVTWTSSPEYDGEAAGTYIFTPELPERLTLASGVEVPAITVTVGAVTIIGTVTAFDELSENIRWQNTTAPEFPETVSGTVEGETVQIPVTWDTEQDYDPKNSQLGLYVFTAVLGDGYKAADGVEPPRMTAFIPVSSGRMAARMAGGGTSDSPLEITTGAQLAEIATLVNSRSSGLELFLFNDADAKVSLKMMNDIDLSAYAIGEGWVPIGGKDNKFKGAFDGGRHMISNLTIDRSGVDYQGLFGSIGTGSVVENLGVENVNIIAKGYIGGVAGEVRGGTVQNCYATGSINSGSFYAGGVAGCVFENGTLRNCYSTVSIDGTSGTFSFMIGGLVGGVYDSTVINCFVTGSVIGNSSASSTYTGGLTGYLVGESRMQNCAALNPAVSGRDRVGRVVGSWPAEFPVGNSQLSGNTAFGGMTVTKYGYTIPPAEGADQMDGEPKTAADINAAGFFEALFGNDTAWIYEEGKLPGFGAAVDMPLHLLDDTSPFSGGDGLSAGTAYQITTAAQLAKLAELVNAGNTSYATAQYELMNDLDLSGYAAGEGWTPIGKSEYAKAFKGIFDGGGHTISNLTINRGGSEYQGLFGYITTVGGSGPMVKNLGIENADVLAKIHVGGVAGFVYGGTVQGCYVTGSIRSTDSGCYYVGGVIGRLNIGTVRNCYSAGSVSGARNIGGVVGSVIGGSTVEYCYSTANVSATVINGGSIAGNLVHSNSTLKNCAALGFSITGTSYTGRMMGHIDGGISSGNIAFDGMIVGGSTVTGGTPTDHNGAGKSAAEISGADFWTMASGFTANWDTTVWDIKPGKLPTLKGIAGQDGGIPHHISGSYFSGGGTSEDDPYLISTPADLAKLAEQVNSGNSYSGKFFRLENDLDLSAYGKDYDGGKGWIPIGTDEHKPFNGALNGRDRQITGLYIKRSAQYQGLFGYIGVGSVKNLGVANVNISGVFSGGGLAGRIYGAVENCYVSGSVSGISNIGGMAGWIFGTMQSCYVSCNVSATNPAAVVGGVASVVGDGGTMQNCYSTGSVSVSSVEYYNYIGGVVGIVHRGTVQNCYSTGNVSSTKNADSIGGVMGTLLEGTVQNCAALNPSVSSSSYSGRVVGNCFAPYFLYNNYAFSRIPGTWANEGLNAKDGMDVTSETLFSGSFWTTVSNWNTAAWDSNVWTFEDGKLPTLKGLAGQSGDGGLSLTARDIQYATVAPSPASFTYNGSEQIPTLTVTFDGETLTKNTDYTVSITSTDDGASAGINAGEVTLTITGIGNFKGIKTATYTIGKAPLTIVSASINPKFYDATITAEVANVSFDGLHPTETLAISVDYTVTGARYNSADAGDNKTVTATVTLANSATAKNYSLLSDVLSISGMTIGKADFSSVDPVNKSLLYSAAHTNVTVNITGLPDDRGTTTFTAGTVTGDTAIISGTVQGNATCIKFSTNAGDIGQTAIIPVTATMQNYKDVVVDVVVTLVNKTPVTITGVTVANKVYDGTAISHAGTPANGQGYISTYQYVWSSGSAPKDAGNYTLTVKIPDSNADFMGEIEIPFIISPATVTITAKDKIAYVGGTAPAFGESDYTVTGLASGETLNTAPTLAYTTTPDMSKTGTYTIIATDAVTPDSSNYNSAITYIAGTLTIRNRPSGGGSSSDSSSVIVTPPAADKPNSPTQGEIKVSGTVDGNGNVTVNITAKAVTDAFEKAMAEARKNGTEQNGITVVLRVDTSNKTGSNVTVNLPKTVQDIIIAKKIVNIVIVVDNPDIQIGMDLATIQEINKQAKSDVNITATRMDNGRLSGEARNAIGSRPVFELRVNYGSGKQVQSFGAGSVSVTIPYTLGANEKAGNIQAVYVNAKGKVHWLTNSVYDSAEKVLRFSTNHFSTYGIGYKQANTAFKDITGHWAKEDIEFSVSRGLFSGTSETKFSPNAAMTRGMFVTALGRLANADVSSYAKSSFSDVKSDAYYMGYIEWASKNSIVSGAGNGKFAPDQSITREQMAVIMLNYAKVIGFTVPNVHEENTFADNSKISTYAKEAVKQMQMAGVISGKNSNLFDPQGTATRAEVSALLRCFVELAISSDTAQGWSMNDSGKWMYYENSKPVPGKKDIDGATYTFDQYGVTADIPKNLRYSTYTVQKVDSFWSISRKLGCTMAELERLNNKSRFALIHPGDVLRVPEK